MQVPAQAVSGMAIAISIPTIADTTPSAVLADEGAGLVLRLAGDWVIGHSAPHLAPIRERLAATTASRLRFDAAALGTWDSVLPSFIVQVRELADTRGIAIDHGDLPEGAVRLVGLAVAVPAHHEIPAGPGPTIDERLGVDVIERAGGGGRRHKLHRRRHDCGWAPAARPGADARARLLARGAAGRGQRPADHRRHQLPGRHDPGLRRRLAARAVRCRRSSSPTWSRSPCCGRWGR